MLRRSRCGLIFSLNDKNTGGAMDAGEDGWEHLGAGLAEGGGAKEADKRERTIISHR